MSADAETPPARVPWPPLLIVATLLFGRALDGLAPILPILPQEARVLGLVLLALALANDLLCARALARHRTTILPHRAATSLVTDGPYRFSRNPIYVSHVATTLGVGLLLHSPGVLVLTPLLVVALSRLAILPEERHLAKKFGAEFAAYAARTPRWLRISSFFGQG